MIEVFDKTRRRVAILENAYAASESQKINSVWYFYFSLPYGDSKNEYCKPFYYVRPRGAGSAVRRIGRGKTPSPRSVPGLRQGSSSSLSFCLRDWRKRPRFRLAPSAPDRRASPESHPRAVLVPRPFAAIQGCSARNSKFCFMEGPFYKKGPCLSYS